ncbi:MAG TPA: hypothetical protein VNA87_01670 [Actinomycetota bacterium]|nr:hypothetical protein [Actinomycetota bacterium]
MRAPVERLTIAVIVLGVWATGVTAGVIVFILSGMRVRIQGPFSAAEVVVICTMASLLLAGVVLICSLPVLFRSWRGMKKFEE